MRLMWRNLCALGHSEVLSRTHFGAGSCRLGPSRAGAPAPRRRAARQGAQVRAPSVLPVMAGSSSASSA